MCVGANPVIARFIIQPCVFVIVGLARSKFLTLQCKMNVKTSSFPLVKSKKGENSCGFLTILKLFRVNHIYCYSYSTCTQMAYPFATLMKTNVFCK